MKCENLYCIYEKDGECILDEIEINASGMCGECILVSMHFEALDKLKEIQRKEFEERDIF